MYLIFVLNILFALTFIIAKEVLQFTTPLFFVGFRMVLAGSLLLLYNLYIYKKFIFQKKDWLLYLKVSIFHIFFPYVFEFWGLQFVTAAKTSMLFNLSPFITAIIIYILFKHKLTRNKIIGLIIGFLGFVPILMSQGQDEIITKQIFNISLPELLIILSVVSSAYGWIVIQENARKNLSFTLLNGIAMLGGGILSFIASFFIEDWSNGVIFDKYNFLFLTFAITIIGNFICYNLYAYLLKYYSATMLSFAGFMIPIFTAILQYIFFGTKISLDFVFTAILVFIGLSIFYKDELIAQGKIFN